MTRLPPRSTPFPYPPLFRSTTPATGPRDDSGGLAGSVDPRSSCPEAPSEDRLASEGAFAARRERPATRANRIAAAANIRSEEHTSELQSRQYLVCRLLLEKK